MQNDTFRSLRAGATVPCAVMLVLALAGCSTKPTIDNASQSPPPTQAPASETASAAMAEVSSPAEPEAAATDSPLIDPSPERLVLAARYGQADTVSYFLDGGMDVDAKDAYGNTALIAAASNGQEQMVLLLLSRDADVNAANKKDMTALMGAAVNGDYQLAHQLIKMGAEVNARNDEGETALHLAVRYGHRNAAQVLLNGAANPNIRNTVPVNFDNGGYTPLMYAVSHGTTQAQADWAAMTQLLLDNGANPNLTNSHGEAALNLARQSGDQAVLAVLQRRGAKDTLVYAGLSRVESMLKAARSGDVFKLEQLLQEGADPNAADNNGVLPLLAAAYEGQLEASRVLIEGGAEVNYVPVGLSEFALAKSHAPLSERELMEAAARGDTALHAAVRQGHLEVARLLLERGAEIGLVNRHGETPLLVAADEGRLALTKLLLAEGADPNVTEQDNRRNRLALAKHAMGRDSVLIVAVENGHLAVAQALIEAGADVDYRGFSGRTALYVAVENGQRNLVQLLLEQGADPNIESLAGLSPLMEAAQLGNRHMVGDLIASGANVNAIEEPELGYARDPQASISSGMTALMFAARGGHQDVVVQLLQAGAQTNIHNANGKNARDLAVAAGYEALAQLLAPGANLGSVTLNAVEE